MEVKKWTMDGTQSGMVTISDKVFGRKAHPQTITDIIKAQLNNQRLGTVSTKTRAEVAGGGRKPWRQKGTGRARQGSIRSPLWIGGGCTFGPKPRCFDQRPPKKMVDRAICGVLYELAKNDRIRVVEKISFDSGKTRDVANFLKKMKLEKALIVLPEITPEAKRATNNIMGVKIVNPYNINSYDLLKFGHLLIDSGAVKQIEEVFSK